jgi:hypothetical protein
MWESAGRIPHECFCLNYQFPLSLARGGSDITAA